MRACACPVESPAHVDHEVYLDHTISNRYNSIKVALSDEALTEALDQENGVFPVSHWLTKLTE